MLEQRKSKRRAALSALLGIAVVATMHWALAVSLDEDSSPEAVGLHP
jgi:hypothetical protein